MFKTIEEIQEELFSNSPRPIGNVTHIPTTDDPEDWTVEVVTLSERNDGNDDVAYRRNGPWGTHDEVWKCGTLKDACQEALDLTSELLSSQAEDAFEN